MLASHRHEQVLGGSKVEAHLSDIAEKQAVAAVGAVDMYLAAHPNAAVNSSSAEQGKYVLEVLALWRNVGVEQMAHMLLEMTPQQRTETRQNCAMQLC